MTKSVTSEAPEQTTAGATEGFMSRWSRRKQQETSSETHQAGASTAADAETLAGESEFSDADAETPQISQPDPFVDDSQTDENQAEGSEEPLLTDADMPAIETITSDSDVSMFFNRGVSRELRKAALKHLFGLPALNITDGLNDYDEDYTTFEPLGDIVTSDMRFQAERKARLAEEEEARKLAESDATESDSEIADAENSGADSVAESQDDVAEDTADNAIAAPESAPDSDNVDLDNVAQDSPDETTDNPRVATDSTKEDRTNV